MRFQCPYHAWIYDLEGKLVRAKHTEDLDDFSLDEYGLASGPARRPGRGSCSSTSIRDAPAACRLARRSRRRTWRGSTSAACASRTRTTYEVDANWKFIAENYSECYHCPGIHPQLNKLTPYDLGGDYAPDGPWQGGWMELVDDAETMALDGGHRARPTGDARDDRRSTTGASTTTSSGRRRSCRSTPTTCSSTGSSRPARTTPGSSASGCSSRTTIAAPGFDPSDAIAFWDLTNRQDWHVCELQQRGTRSRSWVAGRYSNQEPSVHAFDLMAVDRYAGDGVEQRGGPSACGTTCHRPRRTARPAEVPAVLLPRSAARAGARARAHALEAATTPAVGEAAPLRPRKVTGVWRLGYRWAATPSSFWHGPAPVLRPPARTGRAMDHEPVLISTIAVGLVAAFVGGYLAKRIGLPTIVGYIVAGVVLGPFTPGFIADTAIAVELADIGIILLMFGVGIHFSIRDLATVRSIAIPGALGQIVVATLLGVALGMALGWGIGGGLVLGLSLSVGSTVVLLRAITDRGELHTPQGRIAIGWLIVEDIVTVVILVLLPTIAPLLGGTGTQATSPADSPTSPWPSGRPPCSRRS